MIGLNIGNFVNNATSRMIGRIVERARNGAHETERGGTYVTPDDMREALRDFHLTDREKLAILSYSTSRGGLPDSIDEVVLEVMTRFM